MSMLEDRSNYIKVSESASETNVSLGEADLETSSKRNQVKSQKIQAEVQVSRIEDKDVIFSIGSTLEVFILFVLYFIGTLLESFRITCVLSKDSKEFVELFYDGPGVDHLVIIEITYKKLLTRSILRHVLGFKRISELLSDSTF
ncbi:hypothetical protein Tco_0432059 [Tanacetum coccineum]